MKTKNIRKILFILVIAFIPFVFVACGNKATVQGTLNSLVPFGISEEFTYKIYNEEKENYKEHPIGEYKVKVLKHKANSDKLKQKIKDTEVSCSFNFETLEIVQELEVSTKKIIHQSIIRITGGDSLHSPLFAAKIEKENDNIIYFAYANFNKKNITGVVNNKQIKIPRKKIMFDNSQLHQLIRSTSSLNKLLFTFEMSTFEKETIIANNITAETKGEKPGKDIFIQENLKNYNSYGIELRKNTKLSSRPQRLYICNSIDFDGWEIKNVILRFEEYNGKSDKKIIYELSNYKLI